MIESVDGGSRNEHDRCDLTIFPATEAAVFAWVETIVGGKLSCVFDSPELRMLAFGESSVIVFPPLRSASLAMSLTLPTGSLSGLDIAISAARTLGAEVEARLENRTDLHRLTLVGKLW